VLALEERFSRGGEEVMGSTSARVWSILDIVEGVVVPLRVRPVECLQMRHRRRRGHGHREDSKEVFELGGRLGRNCGWLWEQKRHRSTRAFWIGMGHW
jgi:hypothetical protein